LPPYRKTAKRLLRLRFAGERLQAKKKERRIQAVMNESQDLAGYAGEWAALGG